MAQIALRYAREFFASFRQTQTLEVAIEQSASSSHVAEIGRVRHVTERLCSAREIMLNGENIADDVRNVSITAKEGIALRDWVIRERASSVVEVGLAYGVSALHICEGLLSNGSKDPKLIVLDPFQESRFKNGGLCFLDEAGVRSMVDHHPERSQLALPEYMKQGRNFDFGFVDGNHRFDFVFLDLFYLGHLIRKGGIIFLDDYNYPGIRKAVSFFVNNLGWSVEEESPAGHEHQWAAVRTASGPDNRHFRYFADF